MKILDTETTRRHLCFEHLIPAMEAMFVAGCEVPLRHTHTIAAPDGTPSTVLIMPAWRVGGYLGIKTVNIFPANGRAGLPGLFSTYVLYDARTGQPLAQIDGDEITSRRTAAASALAAKYLAREDARRLLVLGTGRVAALLAQAYRAVREIDEVVVWNVREASAVALVERLKAAGFAARFAGDLESAVRSADIVSCATLSTAPLVQGDWLAPGAHLDLIGSFTPAMREADDTCFKHANLFIDTPEALKKSGELLEPMSRGVFAADDVRGTLEDLCRGKVAGRRQRDEITVFKSVGTALEDLAAATLVYEQAN